MTDEAEEPKVHPIVEELVSTAAAPYRAVLPDDVVAPLARVVSMSLEAHPVAVGLVARLSPELRVDVPMHETAAQRNFEGYALPRVQRALLSKVREIAVRDGRAEFIPPDLSMAAVCAFVGYLQHHDRVWSEPEIVVRAVAQMFADGIMAALFLGLMQELDRRPAATQAWGAAGSALADAASRARAVLARAMSRLPERDRTFLQAYRASGWEADRLAKRLRLHGRAVTERCDRAMTLLGEALRTELGAEAPPAA